MPPEINLLRNYFANGVATAMLAVILFLITPHVSSRSDGAAKNCSGVSTSSEIKLRKMTSHLRVKELFLIRLIF